MPHIDSGILPLCPSIVRRPGIPPLYRPRHEFVCRSRGVPVPGETARAGAAGPDPFAHRPAAWVIGTAAVTTVLPEIPPETLAEWQRVVDLTARLARVPASLIMGVGARKQVFVAALAIVTAEGA